MFHALENRRIFWDLTASLANSRRRSARRFHRDSLAGRWCHCHVPVMLNRAWAHTRAACASGLELYQSVQAARERVA